MTDQKYPILYSFRRCPYAMRARMALQVTGQTCEFREILLRNKPDHMLEISPKGTVPVLKLPDGTVLEESLDIMHWALSKVDPENWLPEEGEERDRVNQLIQKCDADFKPHLDRYKYPNRYDDCDPTEHREAAEVYLELLGAILKGQDYLGGHRPNLADHAIFPFIRQFAHTDKNWFDRSHHKQVREWLSKMLETQVFTTIMEKLPPWVESDQPLYRFQ